MKYEFVNCPVERSLIKLSLKLMSSCINFQFESNEGQNKILFVTELLIDIIIQVTGM